jgi:Icc-related predicted phosphoesterase
MGNHEHYHFCYDDTYQHLKDQLPDNVYLLENETKEIDGVIFIGCTLWTDANRGNPLTKMTLKDCMNDYHSVQKRLGPEQNYYGKLSVDATVYVHRQSVQFLQNTLEQYRDRQCVVVTHHAPSQLSISAHYKTEQHMNGGYCSNLDEFILDHPNIAVWTHGHTHNSFDYTIGSTRVICNPRGYKNYEERADDFDPTIGFVLNE